MFLGTPIAKYDIDELYRLNLQIKDQIPFLKQNPTSIWSNYRGDRRSDKNGLFVTTNVPHNKSKWVSSLFSVIDDKDIDSMLDQLEKESKDASNTEKSLNDKLVQAFSISDPTLPDRLLISMGWRRNMPVCVPRRLAIPRHLRRALRIAKEREIERVSLITQQTKKEDQILIGPPHPLTSFSVDIELETEVLNDPDNDFEPILLSRRNELINTLKSLESDLAKLFMPQPERWGVGFEALKHGDQRRQEAVKRGMQAAGLVPAGDDMGRKRAIRDKEVYYDEYTHELISSSSSETDEMPLLAIKNWIEVGQTSNKNSVTQLNASLPANDAVPIFLPATQAITSTHVTQHNFPLVIEPPSDFQEKHVPISSATPFTLFASDRIILSTQADSIRKTSLHSCVKLQSVTEKRHDTSVMSPPSDHYFNAPLWQVDPSTRLQAIQQSTNLSLASAPFDSKFNKDGVLLGSTLSLSCKENTHRLTPLSAHTSWYFPNDLQRELIFEKLLAMVQGRMGGFPNPRGPQKVVGKWNTGAFPPSLFSELLIQMGGDTTKAADEKKRLFSRLVEVLEETVGDTREGEFAWAVDPLPLPVLDQFSRPVGPSRRRKIRFEINEATYRLLGLPLETKQFIFDTPRIEAHSKLFEEKSSTSYNDEVILLKRDATTVDVSSNEIKNQKSSLFAAVFGDEDDDESL